jgi:CubicO group peptidase (beta-lactamase class C family)
MSHLYKKRCSAKFACRHGRAFWRLFSIGLFFTLLPLSALAEGPWKSAEKQSVGDVGAVADGIIQSAMQNKQLPGLVLGIVRDGRVVVKKGYGVKSFSSNATPPDEYTVFSIGSLSKALTGVGAMLLVQEGKLDLDAPASRYLKGLPRNWQTITVGQFLAHQSGIPQLNKKLPTFMQMLRSADGISLSFPPGTRQEYNNFNFAVAGKIIEAVSGTKYLNYMKRRVFDPLHMDHTGANVVGRNAATAYRPAGRSLRPTAHRFKGGPYGIPSGHLQSTLADLLKFYEAIRTGRLLSPAAYDQMITRVNPNFSGTPGWFERKAGRYSIVTKNGATQGFHSIMSFVSDKGDAVVMLWTSQKPKGNGLPGVTNRLILEICGVARIDEPEADYDPEDD